MRWVHQNSLINCYGDRNEKKNHRVACVTKSLWPYFACAPDAFFLLLCSLYRWFMYAFIERHCKTTLKHFPCFHSVNVLINIMTHSICMMSQLAHFYSPLTESGRCERLSFYSIPCDSFATASNPTFASELLHMTIRLMEWKFDTHARLRRCSMCLTFISIFYCRWNIIYL